MGGFINPGSQCGMGFQGSCGGGSFCNSGYCSCATGYMIQNSMCVSSTTITTSTMTTAYVGQSCGGFNQCGGGSFCSSGVCCCPPNFITSGSYCMPSFGSMGLGGMGYGLGGLGGLGGMGYGLGSNMLGGYGGCGYGGFAYPGMGCGGGCGCGGGASCVSSMCTCPSNCIIQNNMCVVQQSYMTSVQTNYVQVGSTCGGMGQMCVTGSSCIQSTCQCGAGWFQQNRMCLRRSNLVLFIFYSNFLQ